MSRFKKGQLVAVNSPEEDDRQWHLRLYENQIGPDLHRTYNPDEETYDTWSLCRPAEEVWPELFSAKEIRVVDQALHAVKMESELVQRLRRQIRWLAQHLVNGKPPETDCSSCFGWFPDEPHRRDGRCATCWEEASLKAVTKEEDHA